jgi:hypothetical protein
MSGENSYIPVRVCSTADIPNETNNGFTMESTANAVLTIDGIAVIVNDWILLRYQTDPAENGLYLMTQIGIAGVGGQHWILVRAGQGSKLKHNMVFQVIDGTINASKQFRIAELDPITAGFTLLLPTTGIVPNVVDYVIGDLTVSGKITSLLTSGEALELNPTGAPVVIGRPLIAGNWFDSIEFNPVVGTGQAINSSQNLIFAIDSANVGTGYEFNFIHNGYSYISGTKLFSIMDNGSIYLGVAGNQINEFSTDGTLSGNSNLALPTEQAVKTYVDGRFAVGIDNHIAKYDGTSNIQSSEITIADTTASMNFLPTTGLLDINCDSNRAIYICSASTSGSIRIGRNAMISFPYVADTNNNIAIGSNSMNALSVGISNNTAVGNNSLRANGIGGNNVAFGYLAGDAGGLSTSEKNTLIGVSTGGNSGLGFLTGAVCIGYEAQTTADWNCQIGKNGEATHASSMYFRSQRICDEATRDGNEGIVVNDATGNLVKTLYGISSSSFGASWFTAWTGDHDVTGYYQKIGNQVSMSFSVAIGAVDVTDILTLYSTGHIAPLLIASILRPITSDIFVPFGYHNTTTSLNVTGVVWIRTTGAVFLYASSGATFTAGDNITINPNITYLIT